ncbi:kynureninase-like [Antedon mediterranea]|uniref:kynureninase-like n=1 Tax=Antedon mediterranea TaxID=105859 RepID=UPI003AF479E9
MSENGKPRRTKRQRTSIPDSPSDLLQEKADKFGCKVTDKEFPVKMDLQDPMAFLREEFKIPKMKGLPEVDLSLVDGEEDCIYMCGNSLGLMPNMARHYLNNELDKWSNVGVYGHFMGELPWTECDSRIQGDMARIVGAKTSEVAVMNALTVNLHLLMISFYKPTETRKKILVESKAFPSDQYMIESQIKLHGGNPEDCIIYASPREGEDSIRLEDILALIEKHGSEIATIMFCGVQYYTGQLFDIQAITKAGHSKGCIVGFDLAHAAGNVELNLHDWDVDFAAWCNYKYMNGGAGCLGGAFMHEKHSQTDKTKLNGWWSHRNETRFQMSNNIELSPGIEGYRISNPSIMALAPIKASLEVFNKTNMSECIAKQVLLTGYFEYLLNTMLVESVVEQGKPYIKILTPSDPKQRGCQLSLIFSIHVNQVQLELKKRGVTSDKREPDVLRFAPVPLYSRYIDVYRLVYAIQDAMKVAALNPMPDMPCENS